MLLKNDISTRILLIKSQKLLLKKDHVLSNIALQCFLKYDVATKNKILKTHVVLMPFNVYYGEIPKLRLDSL